MSNKTLEMTVSNNSKVAPTKVRSLVNDDGSFEFESLLTLKNVPENVIIDYWTGRITIAQGSFGLRDTVQSMFDHVYDMVFEDAFAMAENIHKLSVKPAKKTKTKSDKKTKRSRK